MIQPAKRPPGQFRSGGTSQAERLPGALLPDHLTLDGRTLSELLAYAGKFSELVSFYTDPGESQPGRWNLPRHRTLLLLAEVATQPAERRTEELTARLAPLHDPAASATQRREGRQLLLALLAGEVAKLTSWVLDHQGSNQQSEFGAALGRAATELLPPLRQAAHYERVLLRTGQALGDGPVRLTAKLLRAVGALLPLNADSASPPPAAAPSEAYYADRLRQGIVTPNDVTDLLVDLFWQVHKAQVTLAGVARQELAATLRTRADLPPEMALLVAFLELYAHAQRELNDIPRRHLDYYYEQVLHARRRASQPDYAYLTFALAEGQTSYVLPAGTLVDGGKDAAGQRVLFATEAEAALGSWRVVALATLFVAGLPGSAPAGARELASAQPGAPPFRAVAGVYASALADPATGPGPGAGADARWPLFGADPARHLAATHPLQPAEVGFAVAAPVLHLQEGQRTITLRLRASASSFAQCWQQLPANESERQQLAFGAFTAQATGPAGWVPLTVQAVDLDKQAATITWTLVLERDQPPLVAYGPARHGGSLSTSQPVVRLLLNPQASEYGYSYFAGLEPVELLVQVAVKSLRGVEVSNQLGALSSLAPFYPFGTQALPGAYLLVGVPELLGKNLTSITLALTWQNLPPGGLADYYAGYGQRFANEDFQVKLSYLADYHWHPAPAQQVPLRLFRDAVPGGPALGALSLFTLRQPGYLSAAPGGNAGLVRLELAGPPAGFGAQVYPLALADTARYNARHRKRPRVLPQPPFAPLLKQLTVSYSAEQTLAPSQGAADTGAGGFFHLHPFAGYAPDEAGPVRLLPTLLDEGTLLVGLSADAAGQPVSLVFDLTVPAESEAELPTPEWTYLDGDEWRPLAQAGGQSGPAPGFASSWRVALTLPAGPGATHHRQLPDGWCWLRGTVRAGTAAFGQVQALYTQLVRAGRVGDGSSLPAPYLAPLPAGSLSRLLRPQAGIVGVAQPRPSWGGRAAETQAAFYTRVSEHLRHRGRALTPWDYERIVLERFTNVHSVKCLRPDELPLPRHPGAVVLVVLPQPELTPGNPLPLFGAGQLARMQQYVQERASPTARVQVRNPAYEQVQVHAKVAFQALASGGTTHYEPRLQADLAAFLSPWHHTRPQHGGFHRRLTVPGIAAFLRQLPYVAGVTALSVVKTGVLDGRHRYYDSATDAQQPPDEPGELAPWAVLVPAARHLLTEMPAPLQPEPPAPTGIGNLRVEEDLVVADSFSES